MFSLGSKMMGRTSRESDASGQSVMTHTGSTIDRRLSVHGVRGKPRSWLRIGVWAFLVVLGIVLIVFAFLVFWGCPGEPDPVVPVPSPTPRPSLEEELDVEVNTSSTTVTSTSSSLSTTTTSTTSTTYNQTIAEEVARAAAAQEALLLAVAAGECVVLDEPPPPASTNEVKALRPGCQCGEPGSRGYWAWMLVPTEQIASTWCGFGEWAPITMGMFLYTTHGFICSLVLERARQYSEKMRVRAFKKHLRKVRKEMARNKKATFADANKAEGSTIVLWKEAPKDDLPRPLHEIYGDRIFSV